MTSCWLQEVPLCSKNKQIVKSLDLALYYFGTYDAHREYFQYVTGHKTTTDKQGIINNLTLGMARSLATCYMGIGQITSLPCLFNTEKYTNYKCPSNHEHLKNYYEKAHAMRILCSTIIMLPANVASSYQYFKRAFDNYKNRSFREKGEIICTY